MNKEALIVEINKLRKEKNAVILAHYYQENDIQDIADFVGDSLALAQMAQKTTADIIVLAGVHFMAETAKIINPSKIVLIPDVKAGCSLADSCPPAAFEAFVKQYPGAVVVSYVNTSAEIKALTDIVCTSSNAVEIVKSIAADKQIIFAPDRNLGAYINSVTGRNMIVWDGACHVHEDFSLERILALKTENTQAKILSHPECKKPVLLVSDFIGSTSALLSYVIRDNASTYIVATESGILHQMAKACPEKTFIPAPPVDVTCGCNDCKYMKMISLQKIYNALVTLQPQIQMDEALRKRAEKSILRMLEISETIKN